MLVRHNTKLLEQAIDLQVKRLAIPTLEAEATAHDKVARANAFRRVATGAAIAIAAVGIGIGAALFLKWGDHSDRVARASLENVLLKDTPPTVAAPNSTVAQENDSVTDEMAGKTGQLTEHESPLTSDVSPLNPVTVDYTKFVNRDVFYNGERWILSSGHQYKSENSPSWESAWCYTRRDLNGVDLNIQLVNRESPHGRPTGPVSPPATFSSVGLSETQATELATKCEWLDGARFSSEDFDPLPGRPMTDELVVQDGWDALGNDLPDMPVRNVSLAECQSKCAGDKRCSAITYNKAYAACFMKSGATILVRNEQATMASKRSLIGNLQKSSLVFAKDTVVIGNGYSGATSTYPDCVMACANDQRCAGFNFDMNKLCTLLDTTVSSVDFAGVTSGVRANQ